MTGPRPRSQRAIQFGHADHATRRAIITLATASGAEPVTRPAYRGSPVSVPDVRPLDGMRTARDLEIAARQAAQAYIRAARETGRSWTDIGYALEVRPGADPQQAGDTIAEAAYTYATENPGTTSARRFGRAIIWTCSACDQVITDHGPFNHPADNEHGHAPACQQLTAAIQAWDTQWEAGQ
jgi:hypothetical protein